MAGRTATVDDNRLLKLSGLPGFIQNGFRSPTRYQTHRLSALRFVLLRNDIASKDAVGTRK